MKEERFEQFLQEALACDVQPSDDFTARVMDRIAATPQELPKKRGADKKTLRRMMTALVACAAIVIVIPLGMLMMPKGNAMKAADCAMPEAAMENAMEESADMEMFAVADDAVLDHSRNDAAETEAADDAPTDGGAATPTYNGAPEEQMDQLKANAALVLSGDEAAMVQAILTEENIAPIFTDETQQRYLLTAEQTAWLYELVPELIDVEGVLELTLEVTQ